MRQRFPIFLFLLLMAFDVTGFVLQKFASDQASHSNANYLTSIATHPWAWLAFSIGPMQLWVWTRILSRTDISYAFPLTSLSVPLTMIASAWIFGERPDWSVWVGAACMTAGAAIMKPSAEKGAEVDIVTA